VSFTCQFKGHYL